MNRFVKASEASHRDLAMLDAAASSVSAVTNAAPRPGTSSRSNLPLKQLRPRASRQNSNTTMTTLPTDNVGSTTKVPDEVAAQVQKRGHPLKLQGYRGSATNHKFNGVAMTLGKEQAGLTLQAPEVRQTSPSKKYRPSVATHMRIGK